MCMWHLDGFSLAKLCSFTMQIHQTSPHQTFLLYGNINWKLRCLCQEEKADHLQWPINAKAPNCGYEYLATNLLEFQKLNSLPMNVNLDKLDEGSGIAETLQSHSAMYHKSCYLKYTSSKVQRLQKRLSVTSDAATSPKKTRSQLNVSTCQQVQGISKCFFVMNQVGNCTKPVPHILIFMSENVLLNSMMVDCWLN